MEKKQLHNIFSKPFNNNDWLEVLQNVFGAKQLLAQPREILLPSNDKAKAAFELGLPETIIEFSNGTKLPMVAQDFPAFAKWFVIERSNFFKG